MGTFGLAGGQDYGFAEVFGLDDDPFSPTAVSAVSDQFLLADLHKRPLRLDLDPGLEALLVRTPARSPITGTTSGSI